MKRHEPKLLAVLLSQRSNVFYLEHVRVLQKDDRVVYLTETGQNVEKFFNLPDKNTAFVLLGKGTSITDAAVRKLAESNVLVGFCGSGGSPLFGAMDIVFLPPQNEYRPTEYMQAWMRMWLDEAARVNIAKHFLTTRMEWTFDFWEEDGLHLSDDLYAKFDRAIRQSDTTGKLLSAEAAWAKGLYKSLAHHYKLEEFAREEGLRKQDTITARVNGFLDHGNYIAYGYAAAALHGLGISFALPVLHGKTRRGALVFDVADLVKDWLVMPLAFKHGTKRGADKVFRGALIDRAQKERVLDKLMTFMKEASRNNV
ncbi:MAG: hypothetical protein FD164_540 [Nitrospirae bacterium]|nr:MAG: hypothetical protein FD164_540 [Nitrospirota bacterium]